MSERLNKALADAGLASRRAADRMIVEGRVSVNGEVVRRLGTRVDPERDAIRIDGRRIPAAPQRHTYLMLHKPRGVVTTLRDPEGRPTVRGLLRGVRARVFPIGRLDYHTEGLLLLTDDGELARDLMHPSSGVTKTYQAKVRGSPDISTLERLAAGISIEGRRTLPARAAALRRGTASSWLQLELHEGRKRQIRRMLEAVGHPVQRLRRVRYAGLELGRLAPGEFRHLTPEEVARLRQSVATRRPGAPLRRK